MTQTDNDALLPVEQVDRDAAAWVYDMRPTDWSAASDQVRRGLHDDTAIVQAFARHRLAALRSPAPVVDGNEVEALRQRAATAEHRLYSFRQHRAARSKAMAEFIKLRAPDLWPDYAAMSVNGSIYSNEEWINLGFDRELNILRHRAEDAEERATKAMSDAEKLRQIVDTAAAVFRKYGDLHAAKPDPVKAGRNYDLADELYGSLGEAAVRRRG